MSSLLYGCGVRLMFGIGMGFTTAPATESIMGSLPKAKAGVGSAVNDTTRQTGGALGVAIIGSIFAFRYHQVVRPPPGLNPTARSMVHDSIGRALDAITQFHLPPGVAHTVHTAAGAAFLSGMRLAVTISSGVVVGAVCVAFAFLPARTGHPPPETGLEAEAGELAAVPG
jgi:hypothetical protein